MLVRTLISSGIFVSLLVAHAATWAHCDSVDGPVAKAALQALQDGNVRPVLAYAPASAATEIRAAFEQSRRVRSLGPEATALADRAFLETVVRLHRAGEGAPYTGLKPAGVDYGPVIRAAEGAVETGNLATLKQVLHETLDHSLDQRFSHVRELQKTPLKPATDGDVAAARERVSAELGFITFAEGVRQAALGKGSEHHAED